MHTTRQDIRHSRLMVPDDGGGGTPGQFSEPVLNVALGCVDLRARSSARCPFAQKVVANLASMSAVVDSFSVWRAACFRAAVHSKEEGCRRVVLFADKRCGTLIKMGGVRSLLINHCVLPLACGGSCS